MNLNEMKQKRAAKIAEARSILDKAEREKRELTAEETGSYDGIMKDVDVIGANIQRTERQEALERELDINEETRSKRTVPGSGEADNKEERKKALDSYLRTGKRSMVVGGTGVGETSDKGYYLTDIEFLPKLIESRITYNPFRPYMTIDPVSSREAQVPVVTDDGVADWVGETEAYKDSDMTVGHILLSPYKLTRIAKVSEELLADAKYPIEAVLGKSFGKSFGLAEEAAILTGSGTGRPEGILTGATGVKETATASTVGVDDIFALYHELHKAYRDFAVWVMNDATALAIRKFKSGDNYMWQPSLSEKEPDRLLGRPVITSSYVDAIADTKKVIIFGDFSYYHGAESSGIGIQRLNELYAANGLVGFRAMNRFDAKIALQEAFKILKVKAVG